MLKMIMSPEERRNYISDIFSLQGLRGIQEQPDCAYCAISLTGLGKGIEPNEGVKAIIGQRQEIWKLALSACGVTPYDPAKAPLSPDLNLHSTPQDVYRVDLGEVSKARFVTMTDVVPSTGAGVEMSYANVLGKFIVIMHDPRIRTSRMQVHRALHLASDFLQSPQRDLEQVFGYLTHFDPCFAEEEGVPVMAGVDRRTGDLVNLEKAVYGMLSEKTRYVFDGNVPIVMSMIMNPEIFSEHRPVDLDAFLFRSQSHSAQLVVSSVSEREDHSYGGVVDASLVDLQTGRPMTEFNAFPNPGRMGIPVRSVTELAERFFKRRDSFVVVDRVDPHEGYPTTGFCHRGAVEQGVYPVMLRNEAGAPVAVLEFSHQDKSNTAHFCSTGDGSWQVVPTMRQKRTAHIQRLGIAA